MKVDTPLGFQNFSGVKKKTINESLIIKFASGRQLQCSLNHPLYTQDNKFVEAQNLTEDDVISSKHGFEFISSIQRENKPIDVYDLLDVEKSASYFTNGVLSHNCVGFHGSSGTLISGATLKIIKADASDIKPVHASADIGYTVYQEPQKNREYLIVCDVSRGKGLDYSAFHVIDITSLPYNQVAVFRNNMIAPTDYATFILNIAKAYNNAQVLIEINDIGAQVSDILYLDHGYDGLIFTESTGSRGKRVSAGFGRNIDRGIRTTSSVKSAGCSMLKLLLEHKKLIINDLNTVEELTNFVQTGKSYEAEKGKHDDLVMCLVLFAWLTSDSYFKNLHDTDVMHSLRDLSDEEIYEELVPFGMFTNGIDDSTGSSYSTEKIGNETWAIASDDHMGNF